MDLYIGVVLALVTITQVELITAKPSVSRSPICTKRNGYHKVEGSCDAYIKCVHYVAKQMMCPEGLHFNPNTQWPNYPCGFPADVPCLGRDALQESITTAECPHQFGYFPSATAIPGNCGQYRVCVNGHAIHMECPAGLAFNPNSNHCDWPEHVPSCKSKDFLGFNCPSATFDFFGDLIDLTINYPYEGECFKFFSCYQGKARLLSCDEGLAFDPLLGHCVDADLINCSYDPELTPAPESSTPVHDFITVEFSKPKPELNTPETESIITTPEFSTAISASNTPTPEFSTPAPELNIPVSESNNTLPQFSTSAPEFSTPAPGSNTPNPELSTPATEFSNSVLELSTIAAPEFSTLVSESNSPASELSTPGSEFNNPALEFSTTAP